MASIEQPPTLRVGLGIARDRNRALFTDLLTEEEAVSMEDDVPDEVDVCVVDEATYARISGALGDWKTAQHPTAAPVLLLTESTDPWSRYADDLDGPVDAIQPIPATQSAIRGHLESMMRTRRYSMALETERRLTKRVFETSPIGKTVLDTEGSIVRANRRAEEIFGLTGSQIEERTYDSPDWDIIDEDGDPVPSENLPFARVLRTGDPVYGYEHGIRRPDGDRRWLSINMAPIRNDDGEVEYLVASIDDITHRTAMERSILELEETRSLALAAANAGIWELDPGTDEVVVHDSSEALLGIDDGTFAGTREALLDRIHPADREVFSDALSASTAGDETERTFRIVSADGVERWVQGRWTVREDDGGEGHVIGVLVDITDQQQRLTQLRVLDDVLRHNFHNQMNTVRGYAETILAEETGQTAAYAEAILRGSNRLLSTTDKQREITKILSTEPRLEPFDVTAVVEHVLAEARESHPAVDFDAVLPDRAMVRGGQNIERALEELVQNAVVHNEGEQKQVAVSVHQGQEFVRIDVTDNGPGIPEMEQNVVTGERTLEPLYHGSGLGLWLVAWVVQRSEGTLTFETGEHRGTTVTIRVHSVTSQ